MSSADRPSGHTALGDGIEFDRIREIWTRLGRRAALSGDDCALVPFEGTTLAVSTDMAIEGTPFRCRIFGQTDPPTRAVRISPRLKVAQMASSFLQRPFIPPSQLWGKPVTQG